MEELGKSIVVFLTINFTGFSSEVKIGGTLSGFFNLLFVALEWNVLSGKEIQRSSEFSDMSVLLRCQEDHLVSCDSVFYLDLI